MSLYSPNILLIEDNEGDVELTKIAFEEGLLACKLSIVHNGVEALDYLFAPGSDTPDIILLDLNMPKMDGKEFLDIVKADTIFKAIPIIMLSSSKADADIQECYKRQADSYIIKPPGLQAFIAMAKQVEHFWIQLLPPASAADMH